MRLKGQYNDAELYDYEEESLEPLPPVEKGCCVKLKRREPALQFNFDEIVKNCDSSKLKKYLDAKVNNKFRSSDNKFYQTTVINIKSPKNKKGTIAPITDKSRRSSFISVL